MSSHAVRSLFAALGEEPDETLSSYLISILEDAEAELLDLLELQDVVSSLSASFSSLPHPQQRGLLVQLVKQGHHQRGSTNNISFNADNVLSQQQRSTTSEQRLTQHQQGTPTADEATPQQAEQHQQPGPLLELYPGCSPAYLNHVLHDICHDRLEDAAHWLMDQDSLERSEANWHARQEQLQRDAEQAARQEKASRKQLLDKYHLQAMPTSAYADVHTRSMQASKSKNQVRYREGQVVTAKGEKYVMEKLGPDWDGGSSGKVVTKGKRGKGFV